MPVATSRLSNPAPTSRSTSPTERCWGSKFRFPAIRRPGARRSAGFDFRFAAAPCPRTSIRRVSGRSPPHDTAFVVTEGVPPYRMMIQGPDLFPKTSASSAATWTRRTATPNRVCYRSFARRAASRNVAAAPASGTGRLADGCASRGRSVDRSCDRQPAVAAPHGPGYRRHAERLRRLQGDRPTHPELLDWLATELVDHGWSLKAIHREILLSSTYRQSSARNPEAEKVDPDNQLWWRRPLVRLDAEVIRDAMLAVAGRLDPRPFGPGAPTKA